MESRSLDALKKRLPEYLQSLGLEPKLKGGRQLSCRCPLHADSKPSFTATRKNGVWLWHCFPCNKGGSLIDLHAALLGIDSASAIRDLIQRYEAPLFAPPVRPMHAPKQEHESQPMPWPVLHRGEESDLAALAALRGLPTEAMRVAQMLGYLRFTEHHGMACYALTDGEGKFLQLRRLDGAPFPFPKHQPIKAWNWPGCKLLPLGTRHLGWPGLKQPVLMAEGAVALLELLSLLITAAENGLDPWNWVFMAMPGASARIPEPVLQELRGRTIRIISDADPAGQTARDHWTAQLYSVGCDVEHIHLNTLPELAVIPKADLGDLLRLPFSDHQQATLNSLIQ